MKTFTAAQVAQHNTSEDCWIIVAGKVYDVTKFLDEHPGGKKVLAREGGKDATKKFNLFHGANVLEQFGPDLQIGVVAGSAAVVAEQARKHGSDKPVSEDALTEYGELLPYCDPTWYQGFHSPYYTKSHVRWRAKVRAFVDKEIVPNADKWDTSGEMPREVYKKMAREGILAAVCGPPWPSNYVTAEGPDKFDSFHELILIDEIARCGSGGVLWAIFAGLSIGLPPIMKFGSEYLQRKVARDCLEGDKIICLAITEPWAGSDVANLRTTAKKTPDGRHFIVNGAKKWITNGIFADYFTVAVRTGGPGHRGLSMLLVESSMKGVSTRRMKCMGVWPSGTTYITFEDVKVPVENLIGPEGAGFKQIMSNFNHERLGLIMQANRLSRECLAESFKYAMKRETFGKRLIEHQVIRYKIAEMARQVEGTHHWLEHITHQFNMMDKDTAMVKLGGPVALLKAHSTKVFEYCAREAAQIFGGASYVRGGVGAKIERMYREVRAYAIPGGSEEILIDFAARFAQKQAQKQLSKL